MAIQKFTVSRDDSIYEAWPDLVQTDSGKLICLFSECRHHLDREDARIVLTESLDRGSTWSPKRPLTEKGKRNSYFNCARISKLRDGRLAVICDKLTCFDKDDTALTYVWYGDSESITWSEPVILPFNGIVPDKLSELKNGRLIISNHSRNTENNQLEQHLWYSDDRGNRN